MSASVPTVSRKPPPLPLGMRVFMWAVIVPAALIWPSKHRPALRAVLWCRWRLALLRLRVRLRGR